MYDELIADGMKIDNLKGESVSSLGYQSEKICRKEFKDSYRLVGFGLAFC